MVGEILNGVANVANSVVQPVSNMRQQKRNQMYTQRNMDYQYRLNQQATKENAALEQAYYEKNYKQQRDDQYARENYLLANGKAIEAKALRDAGFNPALANGVGAQINTSPVGAASAPTVGSNAVGQSSANYASPFSNVDLGSAMQSVMKTEAEIKLMKAQADNLKSQTEGNNIDNYFNNDLLWDKIRMTRSEMNQKEWIADYMNSHPELNQAVAITQQKLNEQIDSDIALKELQQDLISAQTDETKARQYLEEANKHLSEVQAIALEDENLRNNYDSVGWLLRRCNDVQKSSLSSQEKADLMVFYGALIDNCSRAEADYRKGRIEDLLNYHKSEYQGANETMHDVRTKEEDDFFSDMIQNVVTLVALRGLKLPKLGKGKPKVNNGGSRGSNKSKNGPKPGKESPNKRKMDIFDNDR